MAIAPIDLQAMYSQMGHLAKIASDQQNGPHLAQQLQEASVIQQNIEKSKAVSKAADNESKTVIVGKDGHNSNQQNEDSNKKNQDNKDDSSLPQIAEIRESYLGNHINIST